MRLLDQIMQARAPVEIEGASGLETMPGAADRAAAVAACPLRYVLQPNVAQRCRDLLSTDADMLVVDNQLLRAPAEHLWVEWPEQRNDSSWAGRTGIIVHADPSGRRGTIETFWEQQEGEPDRAQAMIEFDFDQPISCGATGTRFAIQPEHHRLAHHLLFHLEPAWQRHIFQSTPAQGQRAMALIVVSVLDAAEMLFAFAALILDRPEVEARAVDLWRLNRQRSAQGNVPLLDHLEIALRLDRAQADADLVRAAEGRRTSRLHFVRGHMVRRGAKKYWRRSHLRGDPAQPVVTRTVTVS